MDQRDGNVNPPSFSSGIDSGFGQAAPPAFEASQDLGYVLPPGMSSTDQPPTYNNPPSINTSDPPAPPSYGIDGAQASSGANIFGIDSSADGVESIPFQSESSYINQVHQEPVVHVKPAPLEEHQYNAPVIAPAQMPPIVENATYAPVAYMPVSTNQIQMPVETVPTVSLQFSSESTPLVNQAKAATSVLLQAIDNNGSNEEVIGTILTAMSNHHLVAPTDTSEVLNTISSVAHRDSVEETYEKYLEDIKVHSENIPEFQKVIKNGMLDKKASGFSSRWCVLEASQFVWYSSRSDRDSGKKPKRFIVLDDCAVQSYQLHVHSTDTHSHGFFVGTPTGKRAQFRCGSLEERVEWTDAIRRAAREHMLKTSKRYVRLDYEEVASLNDLFHEYRSSDQGLNGNGLRQLFIRLRLHRYAQLSEHMFDVFDTNGDNIIDFHELCNAMTTIIKGSPEDRLRVTFWAFDIDGSGSISRQETVSLFTALRHDAEPETDELREKARAKLDSAVEALFKALDRDKDGSITFAELKHWVALQDTLGLIFGRYS